MASAAPIVGVLLAAGSGARFGSDKLLHPLSDATPVGLVSARRLRPACDRVLAVVRPDSGRLADLLAAEGFELVVSAEAHLGMGHSLAAGVRAAADAAGWIVALADMPYIAPASYSHVATALRAGGSIVVPEYRGRRGHPVGFARQWGEPLTALTGDEGARRIVVAFPEAIVRCETDDPGIVHDVDRVADLTDRAWVR
ncbi:MAG: nucleotidyltransferase family protein [Hydrogenophilales bacterium]|nr:nucleotidyltransferase family protein [Hydrogenophilales bacterium]